LAPELGAGNVLEMAAKLQTLAAEQNQTTREKVDVRLIAHHSTERTALSAFEALGGRGPLTPPPFLARISIEGEPLPEAAVRNYFTASYALPPGRATHQLTAAAAIATLDALLSHTPRRLHVPAPGGRPGGYPVTISRAGVELDLPDGVSEADAVAVKHSLLIAIYHMLSTGELYHTPIVHPNAERKQNERTTRRLLAQLERLGHAVTLQTATSTAPAAVAP
jgi:hypothetical protein